LRAREALRLAGEELRKLSKLHDAEAKKRRSKLLPGELDKMRLS
jgi:hypothetical protein